MESVIEKITKKVVICLPTDSGLGKDINNISQSNQYPPTIFCPECSDFHQKRSLRIWNIKVYTIWFKCYFVLYIAHDSKMGCL